MLTAFGYALSGGVLVVLATGRPEQIAWRFLRLVGLLALAPACLVTVAIWRAPASTGPPAAAATAVLGLLLATGAAAVVMAAPLAHRWRASFRGVCALAGLCGVAAAAMCMLPVLRDTPDDHRSTGVMIVIGAALGGLLLGSITVAWLLGHAYLTASNMTIAPLRHFSRMLSIAVGLRAAFLIISLTIAWAAADSDTPDHDAAVGAEPPAALAAETATEIGTPAHTPTQAAAYPPAYRPASDPASRAPTPHRPRTVLARLGGFWLVLTLRIGLGLLAVAVFAYMVSDCVRRRATQSATGILYFGSVFAYIGELAAGYLLVQVAWPL
ncbi:MAG: hypothetical protein ACE5E6_05420 [Phycisphaerae bacterium]